ncbi:hypothetical protein HKD37_05G013090 [Glycine soja]
MSIQKEKASWELKAIEGFIIACLEQNGWNGIVSRFKKLTGGNYNKPKFKNRFDNLIRGWRKLVLDGTVSKILRMQVMNGLPFAHKLIDLFKDVVANGDFQWAPLSGILPTSVKVNMNDGYRPSLKGIGLDLEEGSSDSEDASVGATYAFEGIHLNNSQGIVSQGIGSQKSREKRKIINHTEKLSKTKATTSSRITDAISVIVEACKSHNEVMANASIQEVMNKLKALPELQKDLLFHTQCCNLMMLKPAREMFIVMQSLDEQRMHWLTIMSKMNDLVEKFESNTNENDELMEQASYMVVFMGEYAIKKIYVKSCA